MPGDPGLILNDWFHKIFTLLFMSSLQIGSKFEQRNITMVTPAWTHWGRVTHVCVSKLTIIGSDNGLAPGRRQTIIWTNDGILLIGPLGKKIQWKFNRNSNIFIQENAIESVICKMAAIFSRPQCVNTIVASWHHMASEIWFNLAWQHQEPLHEPILISHQWGSVAFTWEHFNSECLGYYRYAIWGVCKLYF